MEGRIMRWDDFRAMCRLDARNWYHDGYTSGTLTTADILGEYPEGWFENSTDDDYDELSSCFTPQEVVLKTLQYLEEIENEED